MSKNPKTDYAYVAGIIDGEGCIMITKANISQYKSRRWTGIEWQLKVVVNINSLRIANKLLGVFGGHIYIRERQIGRFKQHCWHLYGRKACEMLKKIKPYLQEKKEQADLGIKFNIHVSQKFQKRATRRLTENEIRLRDKYYWRMRELKREFLIPKDIPIAPVETERRDTLLSEATVQSN